MKNLQQEIKSVFDQHFRYGSRFILGVSGGKDSMLLAELMLKAGLTFHIAHVNYQLRGEDSDKDQALIEQWGRENDVIVHCIKEQYQKEEKNIQAWARQKRRDYFEVLLKQEKASAIVLAHHLNDLWETHWLKLLRFQVEGHSGMTPWSPPYFRPMLYISKKEINAEIVSRNIQYREDASNASTKYNRNYLRHEVIPEINQRFNIDEESIVLFNQRKADKEIWNQYLMADLLDRICTFENDVYSFDAKKVPPHLPLGTPLFHWLSPFGFSPEQIAFLARWDITENGKKITSNSHVVWKENDTLRLTVINEHIPDTHIISGPFFLDLCSWQGKKTEMPNPSLYGLKTHLQLDFNKISFPCTLRPWRNGEKFQPFGMKGHVLISDYLNQKKIPAVLKSNIVVLESNNKIAAILGVEVADWCKIEPNTQEVWLIHPFPQQSEE